MGVDQQSDTTVKCYYHPKMDAETKCASCRKPICSKDIRKARDWEFNVLGCCVGLIPFLKVEKEFCEHCYIKKFSDHNSIIVRDK
jgi:hypothetical protein